MWLELEMADVKTNPDDFLNYPDPNPTNFFHVFHQNTGKYPDFRIMQVFMTWFIATNINF
jgi:hypothetical protein